ncbi:MAG: hypothetical protein QM652_13850 [Legionella sp.]|uniref:hypothetical protein n=1 Tax=Legionella sp. TaxID=459 RepID=UPI0039E62AAC
MEDDWNKKFSRIIEIESDVMRAESNNFDKFYYHLTELNNVIYFEKREDFIWGCDFLIKSKIEKKNMMKHHLQPLYDEINHILQKKPNPHVFENEQLFNIIQQFDALGIKSVSTRYHEDQNQDIYELYNDQLNIRVLKLHQDIEEVTNKFMEFWSDMAS